MQGISATSGVNASLNAQISAKKVASEGSPAEETKETAAQKAAETARNIETVNAPKVASEGIGKGVNLLV